MAETEIKLPPHPWPIRIDPVMHGDATTGAWVALWNVRQLEAYAREAVLMDRGTRTPPAPAQDREAA